MNLNRNKILFGVLIFFFFVNLLILFNVQFLYLRSIFSFVFLVIVPGLIIMLILKIRKIDFWHCIIYMIGLSIAFMLLGGLLFNWVLPLVGIGKPLATIPLLITFDILIIILWVVAFIKNKEILIELKLPKLNWLSILFLGISLTFPVLSIFGANVLNNQGSNHTTMSMIGIIAVFVFCIILLRNKLNQSIFPWIILFIGISLLLMVSLRSMHISGWDIHREYLMFQLTVENYHWSMANYLGEPYNTCLSITILPTIFHSFLNIEDEYIFKLFIQIIFSIVPVIIYLFIKKYTKNIIAFLAVFFFISKPEFIQGMPTLIRQEISFLFFVLFLFLIFDERIKSRIIRYILLITFGISMILSHYSTSYVALLLFAFTYIVWLLFRKTANKKIFRTIYQKLNLVEKSKIKKKKYYLGGSIVLILFIFSFLWSFQITETSGNLIHFFKMATGNIGKIFTNELKSEEALSALGLSRETYTLEDAENYASSISEVYRSRYEPDDFYSLEKYSGYSIEPVYEQNIPPPNITINKISVYITSIFSRFLQVFMLIGVFYLLFFKMKKHKIDGEYIIMSLGCLSLMALMVFIPYISLAYNFERLFLQTLVLLSFPTVLGILAIFRFLKNKKILYIVIAVIFVWIFMSNSGFNSNIFGGSARIHLNNFGEAFNRFYTHESEVKSLEWLSNNYDREEKIYIDVYANLKAESLSEIEKNDVLTDILPSTILKNAYVYSSFTNTVNKNTRVIYNEDFLIYNFPSEFLNDNKNKIYSSGDSEIFR